MSEHYRHFNYPLHWDISSIVIMQIHRLCQYKHDDLIEFRNAGIPLPSRYPRQTNEFSARLAGFPMWQQFITEFWGLQKHNRSIGS